VAESFFEVMIMRIHADLRGGGPGRLSRRTQTLKHRAGRPSKYTLAIAARICREVRKGSSREAAGALAGISAATLYDWQHRFPEFSEGLKKADAQLEATCVRSIRQAGQNPRNWTANAWLLERKFPQRYGKVDRHVVRTQHEGSALSPDWLQAINRALGVSGEFKPLISQGDAALLPGSNGDGATEDGAIDLPILP
jgi:transposase